MLFNFILINVINLNPCYCKYLKVTCVLLKQRNLGYYGKYPNAVITVSRFECL